MNNLKRTLTAGVAATLALLAIVVLPATGTSKSNDALRSYHGKVTRIIQEDNAFKLRLNSGSAKRFRVNGSTVFERISGFDGLSKGLRIEVKAKKGSSLARKIETEDGSSGGGDDRNGGATNGGGGGGADDGPNHDVGDDHGSGGHGADDGPNHDVGDDHGSGGHGADDAAGDDHGGHHGDDDAGDDHGGHGSDD